jgi:hypothetical protein
MDETFSLAISEPRAISRSGALEFGVIVGSAFALYCTLGSWLWHAGFISTPLLRDDRRIFDEIVELPEGEVFRLAPV